MPHKNIIQIFTISTVLAVILRFSQLFFTIDAATGFSAQGYYEKVNIVVYAIMLLLVAIPTFFSSVSSNRQPTRAPIPKSFPLLTIINFVVAICMFVVAITKYFALASLAPLAIIELILLIVSAVWFIIYATAGIAKIKLPVGLSIAPVLLYLFKLINTFISHNGLANISENLIVTLFLCTQLLFFLLQSKILCKVTIRKSSRIIFPVSLVTFMLMVVGNFPPLFINLMGRGDLLHTSSVFNLEYVIVGAYALIFTMQLYSKSKWPTSIKSHTTERMETSTDPTTNTKFIVNPNEKN